MHDPVTSAALEKAKIEEAKRRLASSYRDCFGTAEGQVVLADIQKHFPSNQPRFCAATGYDPIKAAVADGQSQVTTHIEFWLARAPAEPKQPTTNLTNA